MGYLFPCSPETKLCCFFPPTEMISYVLCVSDMSQCIRFPTMWYVRPAKPQISLRITRSLIRAFASRLSIL